MATMTSSRNDTRQELEGTGCLAALVRLFWLLLANIVLFFLTALIAQRRDFSVFDLLFWTTVTAIVIARYVDVVHLGGLTIYGQPATLRHWRRHTLLIVLFWGVVWLLLQWLRDG
jgi:hypothetical protein